MSWMGYRHQLLGGGPAGSPTVDALCPFGGLESIYSWLKEGYWLRRIALSSFVLFIGVTLATLLTGREVQEVRDAIQKLMEEKP